jgi:hypothetical protein
VGAQFAVIATFTRYSAVVIGVFLLGAPVIGAHFYAQWWHRNKMCERCMEKVPLDPATRAKQRARTLRHAHRVSTKRWQWSYSAPLWLGVVGSMAFNWRSPIELYVAVAWVLLGSTVQSYVVQIHKPLQLWCPQCRGDHGDDHEVNPEPVTPSGVETSA